MDSPCVTYKYTRAEPKTFYARLHLVFENHPNIYLMDVIDGLYHHSGYWCILLFSNCIKLTYLVYCITAYIIMT